MTALIIPCYNEAGRLDGDAFVRFARAEPSVRFLFVDDGSTDATRKVLESLVPRLPGSNLLPLDRNRGKGEAVRAGILRALDGAPRCVGYWDADLATPLSAVPALREVLDTRPDVQAVFGSRVRLMGRAIDRRPARHYAGRVFATAASLVLGLDVYDTQCGAKLFRATPGLKALFESPFLSRWLFDVEIAARMLLASRVQGAPPAIFEFPLAEWHDAGGSKLRLRDALRAPFELTRIYDAYFRSE